jgi:Uncharacterized conserved protein
MNPETAESLEDLKQKGRELGLSARLRAEDALAETEYYVRRNPWIALGSAALFGAVIMALIPRRSAVPPPGRLQVVKDWLDEMGSTIAAQMPDRGDVRSAVRKSGLPAFLERCGKRLRHI